MPKNILITIAAIAALAAGFLAAFFLFPRIVEKKVEVIKNVQLTLPNGATADSPCFNGAGTHYAAAADLVPRPADSPFYNGPSYLVWEPTGKVIAMEYHINEKYMKEYKQAFPHDDGFRFPFEQFQPGVVFDHITLSYLEHGHPGFEIPHYDIHAYTISSAERNNLICK